ncbi:hypothetical protein K1T71_015049 [Dendrolimus kikuchii]|nr:hypothetical protein K1T71_015049 [Dendrolimus kikuchii]
MSIGKINEFDVKSGVWSSYADRLQMYFKVNGIKDELKLPTMIAVMGDEVYELLVNLASPRKPSELDYSEATELLRNHLQPSPSVLAERFRFRQRRQNSDENVNNYVAELKRLARTCNFKDSLNENLRDQFVCGLQNDIFRQRLFAEDESLTFIKAVQVAISLEAAERDAAAVEVRSVPGMSQSVELHAVREGRSGRARQQRGSSAGWSTTRWTGRANTLSIPPAFPFFRLLIDHSISSNVISDADSSESVFDTSKFLSMHTSMIGLPASFTLLCVKISLNGALLFVPTPQGNWREVMYVCICKERRLIIVHAGSRNGAYRGPTLETDHYLVISRFVGLFKKWRHWRVRSVHTCVRSQGGSIVDLSFATHAIARRVENWMVEEESVIQRWSQNPRMTVLKKVKTAFKIRGRFRIEQYIRQRGSRSLSWWYRLTSRMPSTVSRLRPSSRHSGTRECLGTS